MALSEDRLCSVIESLLLISAEPVPIARLIEVVRIEDVETDEAAVLAAIEALVRRYRDPDRPIARGLRVEDVGGALQFRTVAENAPFVRRMISARPQKLSKAALETLAVIAYRQPVTKQELEAIRGVDTGASLKTLLERDLIRILGKREEIGRPIIYGTTKHFLEFFGLRSLAELPTLREYHELDEDHQKEVDALDKERKKLVDLAAAADFLQHREHDPDLEALEQAVSHADRIRREAETALNPEAPPEEDGGPPDAEHPDPNAADAGSSSDPVGS